nr:hypothetical protein [Tanacetum cinerariifolium]
MLINLDQQEKQLGKEEFQETNSMDASKALKTQFQLLINFQEYFDYFDDGPMIRKEYDRRVNKRLMQKQESKVDSSKALDVTECSETKSDKHDTSNSSGNYLTHVVDANIRPVNDQVPFAEEKVFTIAALKNELRKLKGNSVDTKFAKPSILEKLVLQPPRNQSVVRQLNAFKSERLNFSKLRFASQVDVNKVLSKPVTPYCLPKVREYVCAKSHHVIAPHLSRNSQEESFSPNKSFTVHEKPNTPRSFLRWKPTGRIFKIAGLRWIATGKMFIDNTTKVDREPPNGSNDNITNPMNVIKLLISGPGPQLMTFGIINSGLVQNIPSPTLAVPPTKNVWDSFFQPMFDEYFKPPPNVDHLVPEVLTLVPAASTSSPSSTTVDQDAPLT